MLDRQLLSRIERLLSQSSAAALLGPRQVGKTTLARTLSARHTPSVMLQSGR